MRVLASPAQAREWSAAEHRGGRTIGLVPTMGALHRGHLDLVRDAIRRTDSVCVSIFVNPLQFDERTDFDSYPRPIEDDVQVCRDLGVAAVYAPTPSAMYSTSFQTRIVPGALADQMEGAMRPGHFEGVCVVVAKLFNAVGPTVAVFGEKDFQQLVVIRQMVEDFDLGIEIIGHPIVREHDGLAMSSRNRRLDAAQRVAAICVPRSLDAAIAAAAVETSTVSDVVDAARLVIADESLARHEYTTVFDTETLREFERFRMLGHLTGEGPVRIATAVWFDDVRLIDNRTLT